MKRRRITLRGQAISQSHEQHQRIKQLMQEKFADTGYLDQFINVLMRSGWNSADIESAVRQEGNTDRPAVQAFLFHNEDIIDQVILGQGVYTNFYDTASDPNFAIRHPAATELMLRRLTPGDLMLLSAAQHVSARLGGDDRPSEQLPNYWARIWQDLLGQMNVLDYSLPELLRLVTEPMAAASLALDFLLTTPEQESGENVTATEAVRTFMDPQARFYCGVVANLDRVRRGDGFGNEWVYSRVQDQPDSFYMLAAVVTCCYLLWYRQHRQRHHGR